MTRFRGTYRDVDGQLVEGTWRHVFTRNADVYFLTDLVIYADGAISTGTGSLTDLDGLREQLRCGRVVTTLPEGAWASAHHVGGWRVAEPTAGVDPDMLLGEVADEIDRLNDRPDSTGRCLQAVDAYLATPTEDNRLAVRDLYFAIPEHLRIYSLGDMDRKDHPLRVLITAVGEPLHGGPDTRIVTADMHQKAIEYFRERDHDIEQWQTRTPADGPEHAQAPTLSLNRTVYPQGWPDPPGIEVLQNDYPAVVGVNGRHYPSVVHAYWALSTTDEAAHDSIAAAERSFDAVDLAKDAPRRTDWPAVRLGVMATLMRAKYTQHPHLAATLLATGDARITYSDWDSAYWSDDGTNWIGRLLELVRSEIAATMPP